MNKCILLQLAQICSMTFQARVTSMKQKIIQVLIKIVPVEPLNRNKLNQMVAFSYYGLSYITIFYIISISKIIKIESVIPGLAILLLTLLRAVFNLGYIFARNTLCLTLQKLCFMVHCFFGYNAAAQSYIPLIILDIICVFLWSLSLQQRNHHFDSRLGLNQSFIKNIVIELFCFVWVTFQMPMRYQPFYFALYSYSIYILDSNTNYYNKKFKTLLTSLDLCCLISSILPIIYLATGLNEFKKLQETITIINILAVFFLSFRSYEDYGILYRIDPWVCRVSSRQILDYVFVLESLMKSRNRSEIIKYCVHHIRKCSEPDCFIKYHEKDGQNKQLKSQQVLTFFRNQQLPALSKKYQILKEYIIFNFQNDLEKFSSFRSRTNFFHQREYLRFYDKIQERTKQVKSQFTSQFLFQLNLIPIIKKYTEEGLKFWVQLLQLKANATKIIELGSSHLQIMNQIDSILKKGIPLNPKSQLVTHSYTTYLLGCQSIQNTQKNVILKAQDNLTGFREAHPTVLVSAQKQNFLRITNANLGAVKATYYTKEQMLTVKVDALWDKQIRQQHVTLARRRARYNKVSSGQLVRSYAFLKNKFGYVVMADGIVYYFDDLKGKKWCVILEPYLENQPVIVVNAANRQLIGISELSLAYGLRLNDQGKKIDQTLFNQCNNSKKEVYIKNGLLFDNQQESLPSRLNCTYYLKFHTLINFHGKPRYYIFSLLKKNGKRDQQHKSQDSIQNRIIRKQSRERVSRGTFVEENIPNFQFYYSFSSNKYTNEQKQKKTFTSIQTARLLSKQDEINSSFSSSLKISDEEIKIKYDEDIIEMRLWNNKLDFLQNLQAPIPNFDSLPELKCQTDTLLQPKWKEQLIKRFEATPVQIKIIRGFYILVVVIGSALVAYANISSYQNRISKISSFHAQNLIFRQYQQLSSLSSVVLKQFYNQSANIRQQINEKVKQIDSVYMEMQQDPILNNYIDSFKKDENSLTKWDDLYRLVIKSFLLGNSTPIQVLSDFLDNLGIGWDSLAQINLAYVQNKHMNIISQNIIILIVSIFILIALWIVYRQLKLKLQDSALEICEIFLGIDHRVICAEVKKYHSFKQFIDLDKNLIREQSIEQLREQENAENIYQKKASNKQNFKSQSFIFTLALIILKIYFFVFFLEQYSAQKTFQSLFQYMHYSDSVSLEIGKLWLSINLDNRDKNIIEKSEVKIQNYYLKSELISLNQLSKDQTCKKFRSFIVGLSYSSIDKYLPKELLKQLEDNSYKSQKDLLYMFLRKKEKTLIKNQSRLEFQASKESAQLYKLYEFYFSKINKILNERIDSEVGSLNSAQSSRNNQLIIIIAAYLLIMGFSYWLLCRKIRRIVELQKILLYIPFKFVSSNKKYIRYRNKVKIIQR